MREEINQKITTSHDSQVDLSGMKITDDELKDIVGKIVALRPNAKQIYLDHNSLSDKSAAVLVQAFSELTHLEHLDLQFNKFTLTGANVIFELRKKETELTIAMAGNHITDAAAMLALQEKTKGTRLGK